MIDLHTHLLPAIDDGAGTVEEALELTKALYQQNIRIAVCTPHFYPAKASLEDFIEKRTQAMELLHYSKVELIPGSETMLHEYLFHYPDLNPLCINNTRFLLLELPFTKKWEKEIFESIELLIRYYNIIPVIAHIERYPAVKRRKKSLRSLIDMGCLIQLNAASLFDKKLKHQALKYIRQGYIDVLASDCHNMTDRPSQLSKAFEQITKELGSSYRDKLVYNSQCIVNGNENLRSSRY